MPGNDSPSTSDLLRLCREAAAAIAAGDGSRSDPNDLKEVEVATPYGYILGLYMRSRSMFDAITLYLLPNRLSTEAMILARALFEDSLRLERLSDLDEQARAGLILGWVNTSYTDELHLVADVERMGLGDMSQQRRAMATQQQKLSGYVERHGLSLRPFGDLRSLGRRLHRSADVGAYLISHKYVHGNEIALLSRVEVRESGTRVFAARDLGAGLLPIVSVWATRSALLAYRSVAKMLHWQPPDVIFDLLAQCEDIQASNGDPPHPSK